MKPINKPALSMMILLLLNISIVYSYGLDTDSLLKFTPQEVAPAVGQALMTKLNGQDFDFSSILQQLLINKVSAVRVTGTCMKLGDLINLFPEGKCGSSTAGKLYAAHELVLLGKCTSCISSVKAAYETCKTGCTPKCTGSTGLSSVCYGSCIAGCESKRIAGQTACANEYQAASEKAARLGNNLQIAALAYGTAKGSFEGFPCDEILGSCIPTTDAFTDYGSLIACKNEAGLIQRLTTDLLTKRRFTDSVNNGFNPGRYDEIIRTGGPLSKEMTAFLTKDNVRQLSKEQVEAAVKTGLLTDEQKTWLTGPQITDETLKSIGYTRDQVNQYAETEKEKVGGTEPRKTPPEKPEDKPKQKKGFTPGEWIPDSLIQQLPQLAQAYMNKPQEQHASTQPTVTDLAPYRALCEGRPKCKIPPGGKVTDGCFECCYGTPTNIDPAYYCKTDTAYTAAQDAQQKQEELAAAQQTALTAAVVQEITVQQKNILVDSSEYDQKGIKFCHSNGACVYTKNFYKNEIDLMQFYDAGPALIHTMEQGKAKNMYIVEGQGNDGLENINTKLYSLDKDGQTEMLIAYGDGAAVKDESNNLIWLDTGNTLYSDDRYRTNTNFMHINSGIIIKPAKKQDGDQITASLVGPSSEFNNINIKLDDIAPAEKSSIGIIDEPAKATIDIRDVDAQLDLYADNGAFPIVIRENKAYGSKDITAFIAAKTYKDYELKTQTDNYNIKSDNTSTKVTDKNNKVIQDSGDSALTKANLDDYQKNMLDALKAAQS